MLMRVRDNEAVAMDTRLEELVSIFARNPRNALADGGPNLQPLPWDGLGWSGLRRFERPEPQGRLFGDDLTPL